MLPVSQTEKRKSGPITRLPSKITNKLHQAGEQDDSYIMCCFGCGTAKRRLRMIGHRRQDNICGWFLPVEIAPPEFMRAQ